jgi:hypothetical protein
LKKGLFDKEPKDQNYIYILKELKEPKDQNKKGN